MVERCPVCESARREDVLSLAQVPVLVNAQVRPEEALDVTFAEEDTTLDVRATIAVEAAEDPDAIHAAPVRTPVGRLDEAKAARKPVLRWRP